MVRNLFVALVMLLLLASGGVAFGIWKTAKELDDGWNQVINTINKSPNMRASWINTSNWPFWRSGELHLVILTEEMQRNNQMPTYNPKDLEDLTASQESLQEFDESQKPTDLYIDIEHLVLPLYVSGSAHFDTTKGTLKTLLEKNKALQSLPITFSWKFFAYNQDLEFAMNMDQWGYTDATHQVNVLPASIRLNGTYPDALHSEYEWKGLNAKQLNNGMVTEIKSLYGSSEIERWGNMLIAPTSKFHLDGLSSQSEHTSFTVDDVTIESKTEMDSPVNPNSISGLTTIQAKSIGASNPDDGSPLLLEHIDLALTFDGIDKQGIVELMSLAENKEQDMNKLMAAFDRVINRTITFGMKTTGMTVNSVPVQLDVNFQTIPMTAQAFMQSAMMGNLNNAFFIKGSFSAGKEIMNKLSANDVAKLQENVKKGLLTETDKAYEANLLYSSGQFSINNQLLN